ncbi:helix-turn-helix family protein, partial [Vibrio cholerae HC-57A2]|jgi:hypothetical protein
MSED